ncbi:hypothetical protein RJT34_11996 [Clitoria ternatea]|uniref:Uncharacterized protein n=1 Tax=Clitoria ternatea TaxID=43366 RepID=A0AAN9JKZ5_CLITE
MYITSFLRIDSHEISTIDLIDVDLMKKFYEDEPPQTFQSVRLYDIPQPQNVELRKEHDSDDANSPPPEDHNQRLVRHRFGVESKGSADAVAQELAQACLERELQHPSCASRRS